MRIFALNMTCNRDYALAELMRTTLLKYGVPYITQIRSVMTGKNELANYGNGANWQSSMLKLDQVRKMLEDYPIEDHDYILSVDSDVVFTSDEVFHFVGENGAGILGTQHKPPYMTEYGLFGHMSGALIFIRGDIARQMCAIPEGELTRIRFEEFKKHVITENEDVVLSYLANVCGADAVDLPGYLSSGDFEEEIQTGDLKSYYHLNYSPQNFLGMHVTSKWDLPQVLKVKGIVL